MVSLRILRYLKSFTLFITVKSIEKLNPEHNDKLDIKISKLAAVVHVLQTTENLVISSRRFEEDGKEMYQQL